MEIRNLINLFCCPRKVFLSLRDKDCHFSIFTLFVVFVLLVVYQLLQVPTVEHSMTNMMTNMDVDSGQTNYVLATYKKMIYVQVLLSSLVEIVKILLFALILQVIFLFSANKKNYKFSLNLLLLLFVVPILGDIVNVVWVNISGDYEHFYKIGLNCLVDSSSVGDIVYQFLYNLNIFQMYFLILLIWGIEIIGQLNLFKSISLGVFYWLVIILTPIVFNALIVAKATSLVNN